MLLKLLELKSADNLAQAPSCRERLAQYEKIRLIIAEIEKRNDCFTLKDLKINGDTLISLGVPKGKEIGRILNELLSLVMDGTLKNEKEALTETALKLKG